MNAETLSRFWAKVDRCGPDECWPWTGHVNRNGPKLVGYGRFSIGGKTLAATHIALEADGRAKPDQNSKAMHSCDNPLCVNPRHLSWGTHWDNFSDAFRKGRVQRAFTDAQAAAIKNDSRPIREIAGEYGCSLMAVWRVQAGRRYKRLEAAKALTFAGLSG